MSGVDRRRKANAGRITSGPTHKSYSPHSMEKLPFQLPSGAFGTKTLSDEQLLKSLNVLYETRWKLTSSTTQLVRRFYIISSPEKGLFRVLMSLSSSQGIPFRH